jgi:hypothetical protein
VRPAVKDSPIPRPSSSADVGEDHDHPDFRGGFCPALSGLSRPAGTAIFHRQRNKWAGQRNLLSAKNNDGSACGTPREEHAMPATKGPLPRGRACLILVLFAAVVLIHQRTGQSLQAAGDDETKPLFRDDFERDEPGKWDFTDRSAWRITKLEDGKNRVLEQFRASKYEPPVRSPLNIALAPGVDVGDFVVDVKLRSTTRDYGHRDLCLFFGYQDPSHFYYVHLGKEADEHANSIFLVDGKPRVSIAESRTSGTYWTDGWHKVRLVRKVDTGSILVYFDGMNRPVMTARDRTFAHGRLGIGSFDDTGMFDDFTVHGEPQAASKEPK